MLIAVGGWGAWRIADGSLTREGTPIRVGLVQGNIAQEDKWNPGEARRIFTTYIAMTRDAVRRGAQYSHLARIVDAVHVRGPRDNPEGDAMLRDLAREVRVPILFGSDQVIRREPITASELYNAAFRSTPTARRSRSTARFISCRSASSSRSSDGLRFVAPLVQRFAPFSAGDRSGHAAGRLASRQHGDLLRGRLPVARPRRGCRAAASC